MRTIVRDPWHTDFPLTADEAARIVAVDVPTLRPCSAAVLGEGWDFTTFVVNDRWVFRFPKRRQCARQLKREIAQLARLAPCLDSAGVQLPRYRFEVEGSAIFPTGYAGYGLLPGRALTGVPPAAGDAAALARTIGSFLGALHASAPEPAPRIYHDELPGMVVDFRHALEIVAPALPLAIVAACRALLSAPTPPPCRDAPVFVHGDLGAEHILVEARAPPQASVIDWGDAGWGDPLGDYVGLWAWGGDAAAALALDAAGRQASTEDWYRLRYWGVCYAIGTTRYGYKDAQAPLYQAGVQWLTRMHGNGQLADPGHPDA